MIGLDTNVLIRLFVEEEGVEQDKARGFIAENGGFAAYFVSTIALVEFVWTLRSRYGFRRAAVNEAVGLLLDNDDFLLQDAEKVRGALAWSTERAADLSDSLIALAGESSGCSATMTLDRKASRCIPSMTLLS